MSPSSLQKSILLIQGPNLNLIHRRDPKHYGDLSLDNLHQQLLTDAKALDIHLTCRQSNHEGILIDWIHEALDTTDGLLINAGGYTHTSVALADAVSIYAQNKPIIEIHLSNIHERETFRQHSYLTPICHATFMGEQIMSYQKALSKMAELLTP